MKIIGICAEYNPFHSGHKSHIERSRSLYDEESAVVCVMSGNYVQRGEAAVIRKHVRARAAVELGADLVLELPVSCVLSSAEKFAKGAVGLFERLGCVDCISFGSESGNIEELYEIAGILQRGEIDGLIRKELEIGVPYAAARQRAAEILHGSSLEVLRQPNNILGIEYIKALTDLQSGIRAATFTRIGAGHDSDSEIMATVSAANLRRRIRDGLPIERFVPAVAAELIRAEMQAGRAPVVTEALETAILSRLRTMTRIEYEELSESGEGLGLRLMKYALREPSLESLYRRVKTKRYALSRIRRLVMRAFLGLTDTAEQAEYARVLAVNKRGFEVLRRIDRTFPVITKPAAVRKLEATAESQFAYEVRATDLYSLGYPACEQRGGGQEWLIGPEIVRP